jgi:hypothetical protein
MAGVKVTDLTTLGAADPTDVFYIVDTTANQSKQIEVQDIYSGMPQFDSGQFTPTVSNETPGTTTIDMKGGQFSRVNDIVTMNCWFEVQFGVSDSTVTFNISLPVASNFTQTKQLMGIVTTSETAGTFDAGAIVANTTSDLGEITVFGTTGATIIYVHAMFQYQILP